ncbi:hypothetical protein KP509_23G044700 [Ceratopteris richardii]|uniref:Uncharacterized protein n=1 Tax=Ceratopteris richardii TaxID=49495 RepID=A0A8T2S286_CERRI|nr:hypothetical protein KP509_23G044700 [Ceratopteris richardii]
MTQVRFRNLVCVCLVSQHYTRREIMHEVLQKKAKLKCINSDKQFIVSNALPSDLYKEKATRRRKMLTIRMIQ